MNRTRIDTNVDTWSALCDVYSHDFNWNSDGERVAIRHVADVVRGGRVLDVGVGAGRTAWLVSLLTPQYTGIDYAARMVESARRNCPWADIRIGDARGLEFDDESFDFVFFSNAGIDSLNHQDRTTALAEFSRVLRPGGVLIYSTLNRQGPFYKCGPGPVASKKTVVSDIYAASRFVARVALRPREHLNAFKHIRHHRLLFEDHGDWAIDTMPTHEWSLVVHYTTPRAAVAETTRCGFESTVLIDAAGRFLNPPDPDTDAAWFYVVTFKSSPEKESRVQP